MFWEHSPYWTIIASQWLRAELSCEWRKNKSSVKKQIIVRRSVWSMFGQTNICPVKNRLYTFIVTPYHQAKLAYFFSIYMQHPMLYRQQQVDFRDWLCQTTQTSIFGLLGLLHTCFSFDRPKHPCLCVCPFQSIPRRPVQWQDIQTSAKQNCDLQKV